jgi:hypothetical protein
MTRHPLPFLLVCWLVALIGLTPVARANPESLGAWMRFYALALGLEEKDLPIEGEYVDDFEAIVARPQAAAVFGLANVAPNDRLALHNHQNGYWTITNQRTKQVVKVALVWLVRFGVAPEPELADGEPPDHIRGRIVNRAPLTALGFASAPQATSFTIDFVDEAWVLTLLPSGEKGRVPL